MVDDEAAKRSRGRTLAIDTRLRDALRSLRAEPSRALAFSDAAVDYVSWPSWRSSRTAKPHAHVQRKAEDLEARLAALEQTTSRRFMRRFA
jgi:hypothetical protein